MQKSLNKPSAFLHATYTLSVPHALCVHPWHRCWAHLAQTDEVLSRPGCSRARDGAAHSAHPSEVLFYIQLGQRAFSCWLLSLWSFLPGSVPLLAMKLAMSIGLLSMERFLMQPTNCLLCTGKSSGKFGTPPSSRGPVRSNDLKEQRNDHCFLRAFLILILLFP